MPLPDGLRPDEFLAPVDDGSLESAPRGWLDDHADRLSFEPATGWYVDADGRVVGVHPAVGAETYGGVAPDGSGEVWLYNPRTDEWVDGDGVRSEDGPALPEDEPAKGPVDEAPDDQLGEDDDLDFGTGADDKETLEQESTLDDDGSFDVRREVDDPVLDDGSSGDLIDDGQDSLVDEPELREAYDGELEDTREHSRVTAEGDEVLDG